MGVGQHHAGRRARTRGTVSREERKLQGDRLLLFVVVGAWCPQHHLRTTRISAVTQRLVLNFHQSLHDSGTPFGE